MKFAKTLAAESVPEWRAAYINYRGLKKKLTKIQHEVQAELERERERNASSAPNTPLLSPLLNRTRSALFGSPPSNVQPGIPDAPTLVQQGRANSSSATALPPPAIVSEGAMHRRHPSHLQFADKDLIQKSAPTGRDGDDDHPSESIHGGGLGGGGSHDDMDAPLLNGHTSSPTDADPDKELLPLPPPPTHATANRSADTYEPAGFLVNMPLRNNLVGDAAIQPMAPKHLYKALSSGSDGDDDEESPKSPPPLPTSTAKDPSIASAPPLTTHVHAATFHHSPLNPNRSPSPPRPASLPLPAHSQGSTSRFPIPLEQLRGLNSSEDLNEMIMEARLQSLTQPAPESPIQFDLAQSLVGSPQTFPPLPTSPFFHGSNAAVSPNTRPVASVSSDDDVGGAPTMGTRRMSFRDRARARVSSFRSNYSTLRKRLASSATLHSNNEPILPLDDFLAGRPAVERDFFKMLDSEMEKITKFFNEQVSNHRATMAKIKELIADMEAARRQSRGRSSSPSAVFAGTLANLLGTGDDGGNATTAGSAADRSFLNFLRPLSHGGGTKASRIKVLKSALLEEYKALTFLRNYQILNFTGLFKILKKFDKTTGWRSSRLYVAERAPLLSWDQDPSARNMLKDIEQLYCKHFAGGKRQDGMRQLRLPDRRHATYQNATWLAGFYLGVGICLFVQAVVSIFQNDMHHRPHFVPLVQIYGGFLMPILFAICFVGCLFKWSTHGVNYVFIFEFDFRDHIHYLQFLQLPSFVFLIWSVFVFLTLAPANDIIGINPLMLPIVFAGVIVAFFVNPINVFHRSARYWLIRTLARVIASPFHKILFRDFFLTDILCSLVYTLTSLPLFFCVSIGGDIDCDPSRSFVSLALALFPYATRFAQCVRRTYDSGNKHPHMTNAGKYFFGMCVISASFKWRSTQEEEEWLIVWILLSICATVYAVSWDMFFDWGLMDPEHKLLRSELVFPSNAMYYFALVTNSLLRLGWVIQISPGHFFPTVPSSAIALTLAILEILRRVQWCLYRMENEHLSNCGQFRATKEIPLPRVHHPSDEDDDLEAHGRRDESGSSSDGTRGSGGVIRMLRMNSRAARERSQSRSRSPSPDGLFEEIRRVS